MSEEERTPIVFNIDEILAAEDGGLVLEYREGLPLAEMLAGTDQLEERIKKFLDGVRGNVRRELIKEKLDAGKVLKASSRFSDYKVRAATEKDGENRLTIHPSVFTDGSPLYVFEGNYPPVLASIHGLIELMLEQDPVENWVEVEVGVDEG